MLLKNPIFFTKLFLLPFDGFGGNVFGVTALTEASWYFGLDKLEFLITDLFFKVALNASADKPSLSI